MTPMDGYMDGDADGRVRAFGGGGARLLKKGDMAALALPVTTGGALYHLLFEAKAQYAYPYMVYCCRWRRWPCAGGEAEKASADERQKQQRHHEQRETRCRSSRGTMPCEIYRRNGGVAVCVLRDAQNIHQADLTSRPPMRERAAPATPLHSSSRKLNSASAGRTSRPSRRSACSFHC